MKHRLLDILACPACRHALTLIPGSVEEDGEILEGELICDRGHFYPIVGGVPRLLLPQLLTQALRDYHPEVYDRYAGRLREAGADIATEGDAKKRTLSSFSFQWNTFSEMYTHWEENFRSYFEPLIEPVEFRGRLVLDAGCGFGRHAYYSEKFGAEVVAMDLSEAVNAAFTNTRPLADVHVIQGDLYNPPLRPAFDLIYCVGVIQHTPDPEAGFRSLSKLLNEAGELFVWVYGKRRGLYRLVDAMRHITTRTPMGMLYGATYVLNLLCHLGFSLPYKVVRAIPGMRRLADKLPFTRYADLPLRVGHADWFDRLSVPLTAYFSRDDVEGWFRAADLQGVDIVSRDGIGWRALGRRYDMDWRTCS